MSKCSAVHKQRDKPREAKVITLPGTTKTIPSSSSFPPKLCPSNTLCPGPIKSPFPSSSVDGTVFLEAVGPFLSLSTDFFGFSLFLRGTNSPPLGPLFSDLRKLKKLPGKLKFLLAEKKKRKK